MWFESEKDTRITYHMIYGSKSIIHLKDKERHVEHSCDSVMEMIEGAQKEL